jgi:hypothetical protein
MHHSCTYQTALLQPLLYLHTRIRIHTNAHTQAEAAAQPAAAAGTDDVLQALRADAVHYYAPMIAAVKGSDKPKDQIAAAKRVTVLLAAKLRASALRTLGQHEAERQQAGGAALSPDRCAHFVAQLGADFQRETGAAWSEGPAVELALQHSVLHPSAVTAVVLGQCDRYSAAARSNSRGLLGHAGHFACSCSEVCQAVNELVQPAVAASATAAAATVQQQCSTATITWLGRDVQQYCGAHIERELTPQQLASLKHTTTAKPLEGFRSKEWLQLHRANALRLLVG